MYLLIFTLCISFSFAFTSSLENALFDINPPRILNGVILDTRLDAKEIEHHAQHLEPKFHSILSQDFFNYYKVDYLTECPFWVVNYLCSIESGGHCGVKCCDDEEIPTSVIQSDDSFINPPASSSPLSWNEDTSNTWLPLEDPDSQLYVDLSLNPEKYTGYSGFNATRIWLAIYKENCFTNDEDQCLEKQIFFRLISGFHASTNAHIAYNYVTDGKHMPNRPFFKWRLGMFPDRLENIYFSYAFLYRAACKAQTALLNSLHNFPDQSFPDEVVSVTVKDILSFNCGKFHHPSLNNIFETRERKHLRSQLQTAFQNISRLIDCVSCESCKVHSKLQILGIGTALKIMMFDSSSGPLTLTRHETVALFHTIHKLSESIQYLEKFRLLDRNEALFNWAFVGTFFFALVFLIVSARTPIRNRKDPQIEFPFPDGNDQDLHSKKTN